MLIWNNEDKLNSDPFLTACMPKIKTARSIKVENLCDFNQAEEMQKVGISFTVYSIYIAYGFILKGLWYIYEIEFFFTQDLEQSGTNSVDTVDPTTSQTVILPSETKKEATPNDPREEKVCYHYWYRVINQLVTCSSVFDRIIFFQASTQNETTRTCEDERLVYLFNWLKGAKLSHSLLWLTFLLSCRGTSSNGRIQSKDNEQKRSGLSKVQNEACTPLPTLSTYKDEQRTKGATSKKHETARKIASMVKNPSTLKARSLLSQTKSVKPNSVKRLDFVLIFSTISDFWW